MAVAIHEHDIVALVIIAAILVLLGYTVVKHRVSLRHFFKHNDPPPKR